MITRCVTFVVLSMIVPNAIAQNSKDATEQLPKDAVAEIGQLLKKKDFATVYTDHCHQHLRRQLTLERFVKYMETDDGTAISKLFTEIQDAIKTDAGEYVLVEKQNEDATEYEFILVKARQNPTTAGQQWHLELMKEDGKWKLKDTD